MAVMIIMFIVLVSSEAHGRVTRSGIHGGIDSDRPVDDLFEFSLVEPYPAALRAMINLYTLTVGHQEGYVAFGTVQGWVDLMGFGAYQVQREHEHRNGEWH